MRLYNLGIFTVFFQALFPLSVLTSSSWATTATTAALFPRDSREFYMRSYQPNDLAADDDFCYRLAATCPYLTSPTARPSSASHIRVRVGVDFRPTHFLGIDDLHYQFSVTGTFIFNWQLPRCARWLWTQEQYDNYQTIHEMKHNHSDPVDDNDDLGEEMVTDPHGPQLLFNKDITECYFRKHEVWHPSIKHLNAIVRPDVFESFGRDVIVTGDARAHWEVSLRLDSTCSLTFKTFPFDRQRCSITLGQYNYHDFIFADELIDEDSSEDMFDTLLHNSIWQLEELSTSIYPHNFSITFDVTRISESYAGTIFIPTSLLSVLQMSTVLMPPETTDRSAFSITGFVALAVFQSLFTSSIPRTSEILFITIYYEVQMAIGVMITIYSLLICRLLAAHKRLRQPLSVFLRCRIKFRLVDLVDLLLFFLSFGLFLIANVIFIECGHSGNC